MYLSKKDRKLQENLRPCPFCRGKAIFTEDREGFAIVQCRGCGAHMDRIFDWKDVIDTWNIRYDN